METWEGLGLDLVSDWKLNVSVSSRSRAIGSRLQANVHSFLLHCKIAPTSFWMQGVCIVCWFTSLLIYCNASAMSDRDVIPQSTEHSERVFSQPLPVLIMRPTRSRLSSSTLAKRVFNGTLQLHCKFRYCHKMSRSVCRLSMKRVYYDKTADARIMQLSLKYRSVPQLFACQVWLQNSKKVPLIRGLKLRWGGFRSSSRCYISQTLRDRA